MSHANEKGWYGNLFKMLLVRNGIANLLSVPQLERDGFFLTYDTRTTCHIHCPDGKFIALDRELGGFCYWLCYIDMSQPLNQSAVSLVNIVRENYEGFTSREVEKSIMARKSHGRVGNPYDAEFVIIVSKKTVKICLSHLFMFLMHLPFLVPTFTE